MELKKLNLLLVAPHSDSAAHTFAGIASGTAYINAALRNHGFNVECFCMSGDLELLKAAISECKIDILLCGGLTFQYKILKSIFDSAKEANREIITIGGGGGFTSEPVLFSEMCGVDFAVIGEGEITVCELISALTCGDDISNIDGIVYKKHDKYIQTQPRKPIDDLDSIPFPSYDGFPVENELPPSSPLADFNTFYADEARTISIVYSRSCPFKCSFCFHPTGDKYRTRTMDNFFKEVDLYVEKYSINGLTIVDECFRMDDSVFEFCRRIKPYNLKWVVSLVAKTVTYEKLMAMKDAGCFAVSYGIESISRTVLQDMRKPSDPGIIENALKITEEAGLKIQGNFIFGAEAETIETVHETLRWWLAHRHYPIELNIVTPYPGSWYYDNSVKRGIIKDKREYIELGCPWVNMSKLSDFEFERIITLISLPPNPKLAWDFAFHSEVFEVIPNYKGNPSLVSIRVRCAHCGELLTYGNISKSEIREAFPVICRSCGKVSTFGYHPNFNYSLLCQWVKNEINGTKLLDWISKREIKSVVIYGLGELGVALYKYLESSDLVIFVTDKNPRAEIAAYTHMKKARFVSIQKINSIDADLVLVAPSYGKQEIIAFLQENGCNGRIETLFDIVFGIADIYDNSNNLALEE